MNTYSKSKLNRVKRGHNRATYDVTKINTILDAGFIGYVSYIYENKAITLPMAYGREDNKIYLHGSQGNRMLSTLLEAKEMSMTVMHLDALVLARSGLHHSVNYRSATLFGSVKNIEAPKDKEAALFCFMEHMMKGRWDAIRPPLDIWAGLVPLKQVAEYPIPDKGLPQKMDIPEHILTYYQEHKT